MKNYILTIDQGTTSTRAIIFDNFGNQIIFSKKEIPQITTSDGVVEQDPEVLWESVVYTVNDVISKFEGDLSKIKVLGITNQRETTLIWNKKTGECVHNAIVWQSIQSKKICNDLVEMGYSDLFKKKTGLIISPYFSASKIKWIFDRYPELVQKAKNKEILFGTVDTYLVWKLTNGKKHITDYSNASRTMLFNIHDLCWDNEILEILDIPKEILPSVVDSSGLIGEATYLKNLNPKLSVEIGAIIGDQQASLFGHCCFNKGDIKNTYGTGCFMLMNTQEYAVESKTGLLTTIAWSINNKVEYALEGSVFIAGAVVQWIRDNIGLINSSDETESICYKADGSDGVIFVPAFTGLGTPYWDSEAKGSIFGLNKNTKKENIVAASIEAIAFQSKDIIELMKKESTLKTKILAVDGGASVNNYLMQFQADILNCKIVRPECLEMTALGAAYLAGLALNLFNVDDIKKMHCVDEIFESKMSLLESNQRYKNWKIAIKATQKFKTKRGVNYVKKME